MEITYLEEYHDAIIHPTIFDIILVKRVGYTQLYDLDLSESVGQNVLGAIFFSFLLDHLLVNEELSQIS